MKKLGYHIDVNKDALEHMAVNHLVRISQSPANAISKQKIFIALRSPRDINEFYKFFTKLMSEEKLVSDFIETTSNEVTIINYNPIKFNGGNITNQAKKDEEINRKLIADDEMVNTDQALRDINRIPNNTNFFDQENRKLNKPANRYPHTEAINLEKFKDNVYESIKDSRFNISKKDSDRLAEAIVCQSNRAPHSAEYYGRIIKQKMNPIEKMETVNGNQTPVEIRFIPTPYNREYLAYYRVNLVGIEKLYYDWYVPRVGSQG